MRNYHIAIVALAVVGGCAGETPTTPNPTAPSANASYSSRDRYPGGRTPSSIIASRIVPVTCLQKTTANGSAIIGPEGGTLRIGPHRLIIPSGALTRKIAISGSVPAGSNFEIDLQPHGLQFRKAAGLILDTSSCIDVPTIIYVVDQVEVGDPIPATYSTWWMAYACPIWHFSGYMIALGDNRLSDEIGAQ